MKEPMARNVKYRYNFHYIIWYSWTKKVKPSETNNEEEETNPYSTYEDMEVEVDPYSTNEIPNSPARYVGKIWRFRYNYNKQWIIPL